MKLRAKLFYKNLIYEVSFEGVPARLSRAGGYTGTLYCVFSVVAIIFCYNYCNNRCFIYMLHTTLFSLPALFSTPIIKVIIQIPRSFYKICRRLLRCYTVRSLVQSFPGLVPLRLRLISLIYSLKVNLL